LGKFQFNEVVEWLLGMLGVNGAIISLVTLAFVIDSWRDPFRRAAVATRQVAHLAEVAGRMPRYRLTVVAAVTTMVAVAQCLVIYLCYVIGNFLSVLLFAERGRKARIDELIAAHGFGVLNPWSAESALRMDWLSGTYAACAIAAIVLSYRGAWGFGIVLTLPVVGFAMLAMLGVAGTLISGQIDVDDEQFLKVAGTVIAVGVFFCVACIMSLRGSKVVSRSWKIPAVAGAN
jgi:hypothetical protein